MNAVVTDTHDDASAQAVLRTLVVTDLADSTALVESMGDRPAAELIRRHDRMVRSVADRHGGREIDKTDGFLLMFDRPIQAVAFALDYQRALRQLNAAEHATLAARVGVHVGDVVIWENAPEDVAKGAKPVDVEGLVKPVASRLMNLALPGQILLSSIAHALAHRAQGELGVQLERVRWRTYGRYRFRGLPDPVPVFEVGEDGVAPLKAPPWSGKAYREIPFWRRPTILLAEAAALVAFVAIPAFMIFKPAPAIAFADRDWVIVGNLNNLTREPVFDETLQGALRIALEQSRYVNVLPDLKVRDTVKRMQRDPATTRIDRTIGSEIAIRDGVKALILPTVAEVGGRIRVTAEVVDPHTQTTVYSESADGIGTASVLPSLDLVNQRLRVRLGEALATVSQDSRPLEKVATKNLDALRMFSQAATVIATGDVPAGIQLYRSAIEIDPDFALARLELADRLMTTGGRTEASEQIRLAMTDPGRLTIRDRMFGEALQTDFTSPAQALLRWKVLAEMFPDYFRAQGIYGYYVWHYANDFPGAIEVVARNAVDRNPKSGVGHYLMGALLVGVGRYEESGRHFRIAEESGLRYQNNFHAALFAAQRQYDKAEHVLGKAPAGSGVSLDSAIFQLARALDQGRWNVLTSDRDPLLVSEGMSASQKLMHRDAVLGLRFLAAGDNERRELLRDTDKSLLAVVKGERSFDPRSLDTHHLFRAWLAATTGQPDQARDLMLQTDERMKNGGSPVLRKLRSLVVGEIQRAEGKPEAAVTTLLADADDTGLYASRVALMHAMADAGNDKGVCDQARWLSTHRGRAYTEVAGGLMFLPFNVAQSNLALLSLAECSSREGNLREARESLSAFTAAWPEADLPPAMKARAEKLEKRLESPEKITAQAVSTEGYAWSSQR